MKIEPPVNTNYAATVIRVRSITPLDNCDNVVGVPVFGYQAVTSKDITVGELRVLFTAETQLSEEYARLNNLHRHGDRNADESAKGYLEDNRRIKAVKFRGHRSDALLMPLESLDYLFCNTSATPDDLVEGDVFDQLDGHEICKKYVIRTREGRAANNQQPKETRVDKLFFPEHFDTGNWWREQHTIPGGTPVVITQKIHGTSIRVANTLVNRKLNWLERLAKKLGVAVSEKEYAYVFGSRKVTKDPNNPDQNHFYEATTSTHTVRISLIKWMYMKFTG